MSNINGGLLDKVILVKLAGSFAGHIYRGSAEASWRGTISFTTNLLPNSYSHSYFILNEVDCSISMTVVVLMKKFSGIVI